MRHHRLSESVAGYVIVTSDGVPLISHGDAIGFDIDKASARVRVMTGWGSRYSAYMPSEPSRAPSLELVDSALIK